MTANITIKEYLKSFFYILEPFNRYRKTYKNFFHVMYYVLKQKFPISAVLKNGEKKILKNYYETYLTSFQIMDDYRIDGTVISISKSNMSNLTSPVNTMSTLFSIYNPFELLNPCSSISIME